MAEPPGEAPTPQTEGCLEVEPGGMVTLNLSALIEHARCPICMGLIKETRAVSVCMHRFCKKCIEAWLRTQKDNSCPQCRAEFASRRDCKPDPRFDQLLAAIFGDAAAFDRDVLEPSSSELAAAKAAGSALAARSAAQRRAGDPRAASAAGSAAGGGAAPAPGTAVAGGGVGPKRPGTALGESSVEAPAPKRAKPKGRPKGRAPGPGSNPPSPGPSRSPSPFPSDGEPARPPAAAAAAGGGSPAAQPGPAVYRGVRPYVNRYMAYGRAAAGAPQLSLGQYDYAEDAGRAADLHYLRHEPPGRVQRSLNFPHLLGVYMAALPLRDPGGAALPKDAAGPGDYEAAVAGLAAAAAAAAPPAGYVPPAVRSHESPVADAAAGEAAAGEAAAARARALAARAAAAAAGGGPAAAHVALEPAAGAEPGATWALRHLACPAGATVAQLKAALAAGLAAQHGAAAPLPAAQLALGVRNELDAGADFDAVCSFGPGGGLVLRDHVQVGALCGLLADGGEGLALEYWVLAPPAAA